MVSIRKALGLLLTVGLALGVVSLSLLGTLSVAAQTTPSVARSLSVTTVEPGGEVEVTITADDYGGFATVVETLPDGFSYVERVQS